MTISYNTNIPFATNNPSNDQPLMETNTNSINTWVGIDHYGFNVSTPSPLGGQHKQVTLINEAAPGIGSGNGVLYANSDISGNSWPFWQNSDTGSPYQLTGSPATLNSNFAANPNGYTFLPGGMLFQYGTHSVNLSGSTTLILYPVAFKTAALSITIGVINSGGSSPSANNVYIVATSVSTTGFTVSNSSSGSVTNIYFMAVGI